MLCGIWHVSICVCGLRLTLAQLLCCPAEKHAVLVATAAVDKHKQLKDVAQFIKHEMDKKFPAAKATEGVYHCVVGKSFASKCSAARWQLSGWLK